MTKLSDNERLLIQSKEHDRGPDLYAASEADCGERHRVWKQSNVREPLGPHLWRALDTSKARATRTGFGALARGVAQCLRCSDTPKHFGNCPVCEKRPS